jgi:hypothetical protein
LLIFDDELKLCEEVTAVTGLLKVAFAELLQCLLVEDVFEMLELSRSNQNASTIFLEVLDIPSRQIGELSHRYSPCACLR